MKPKLTPHPGAQARFMAEEPAYAFGLEWRARTMAHLFLDAFDRAYPQGTPEPKKGRRRKP